jgi:hypothetical protein
MGYHKEKVWKAVSGSGRQCGTGYEPSFLTSFFSASVLFGRVSSSVLLGQQGLTWQELSDRTYC